jgi:hypothetical protein
MENACDRDRMRHGRIVAYRGSAVPAAMAIVGLATLPSNNLDQFS